MKRLTILLGAVLVAGCVCTSVDVENAADQPIFVNKVDLHGAYVGDYDGILLAPGEKERFFYVQDTHIRVRTLDGETVALHEVSDSADDDIKVTDLTPLEPAVPVLPPVYSPGPTRSSAIVCVDGDEQKLPLFRTVVTVENASETPLVVSLKGDWKHRPSGWQRGALLTAGGTAHVTETVVDFGWLRAYDETGTLVFLQSVPRARESLVTIGPDLQQDVEEPPIAYPDDCFRLGWLTVIIGVAVLVGGAVIVAFLVVQVSKWWWRHRT